MILIAAAFVTVGLCIAVAAAAPIVRPDVGAVTTPAAVIRVATVFFVGYGRAVPTNRSNQSAEGSSKEDFVPAYYDGVRRSDSELENFDRRNGVYYDDKHASARRNQQSSGNPGKRFYVQDEADEELDDEDND